MAYAQPASKIDDNKVIETNSILIKELLDAPNWDRGDINEQKLIDICKKIATLKTDAIREIIIKFNENDKSNTNIIGGPLSGEGWRKIYVLNRVCFNLSDNMPVKKLLYKDWLGGGKKQLKIPYDPDELVDGIYPVSVVGGKLFLTGQFYFRISKGNSYPVLDEFDFFSKTLERRKM